MNSQKVHVFILCICFVFRSWVPVFFDVAQKLAVMSIGFLLQNTDDAVVWRGPKKNGSHISFAVSILSKL